MKLAEKSLLLAAAILLSCAGQTSAQAPKAKAPTPAPQAAPSPAPQPTEAAGTPAQPGWIARCGSAGRAEPLECAIEESAVLAKTGQVVVLVNIRVTSDTRMPVATVQLPLGLNLPLGAKLQVDDGKTVDLPVQTCENRGCYANLAIAPDLLAAMRSGKQLKFSFQNLAKDPITIPMPLTDLAAAYDKIK
jgi:invasion protein IalB